MVLWVYVCCFFGLLLAFDVWCLLISGVCCCFEFCCVLVLCTYCSGFLLLFFVVVLIMYDVRCCLYRGFV